MPDDATFYREREAAERLIATTTSLINIRTQSLRAAERWGELAKRSEVTKANAALRIIERGTT